MGIKLSPNMFTNDSCKTQEVKVSPYLQLSHFLRNQGTCTRMRFCRCVFAYRSHWYDRKLSVFESLRFRRPHWDDSSLFFKCLLSELRFQMYAFSFKTMSVFDRISVDDRRKRVGVDEAQDGQIPVLFISSQFFRVSYSLVRFRWEARKPVGNFLFETKSVVYAFYGRTSDFTSQVQLYQNQHSSTETVASIPSTDTFIRQTKVQMD